MRVRTSGILLVLALVGIAVFAGCEPADTEPYKITVTTEIHTWNFDGVNRGAERETPVTLSTSYGLSEAEWDEGAFTTVDQNDPEWVDREEAATSTLDARYVIKHGGSASASGCRGYTQKVDAYSSVFNSKLYEYYYSYDWCWYLTTVYNPAMSREVKYIASNWDYRGLVDSYTGYYDWGGFYHHKGGYRWYRKLHFASASCINVPVISNCDHRYPWNKFWAHSNGTFSTSTSDMQS